MRSERAINPVIMALSMQLARPEVPISFVWLWPGEPPSAERLPRTPAANDPSMGGPHAA